MQRTISRIKKSIVFSVSLLVLVVSPVGVAFADDSTPSSSPDTTPTTSTTTPPPCVAPTPTDPGNHVPTGADAGTFTYQCDGQYAGDWTNQYYVYYPATNTRAALYDPNYAYNCDTGKWYMIRYDFVPASGTYVEDTVKTTAPAGYVTDCPAPNPPAPTTTTGTDSTPTGDATTANTDTQPSGSTNIGLSGTNNTIIGNGTIATMSNGLLSIATSGNAGVVGNTTAGNATSGNAQAIANVINLLQSSTNILNDPNLVTFTANINGDVNGDLLLDPSQLGSVQNANTSTSLDNNVTVNNSTDASLNNDITLGANSGNADVKDNTTAGNATSGTADAVADIVNILNSAVTAGRSFMGVININGNLNGDILLPPNFVNTLLASNVPRYTVNTATLSSNVNVNNTNNSSINNALNASAQSGNATVNGNTTGGNATSGLADTDLTVFNLTGSNLVANNDLLVFVNVVGSWYGMIMNAPAGTTAASLGGGVTSNTSATNDATLDNANNDSINNTVDVNAQSGNANVSDNTTGGNATSGNANASINLLNMINDSLSLNGWFGLLFINVFGTWNGSFGINTSAGDPVTTQSSTTGASSGSAPMFRFVPVSTTVGGSNKDYDVNSAAGSNSGGSSDAVVLAAKTVKTNGTPTTDAISPAQKATNRFVLPIVGTTLAFLILLAGERRRFINRT